jgi:hypothetical protein
MEIDNPFKEDIPAARKLRADVPPSPHASGRAPKMTNKERRLRTRRARARIQSALDEKVLANA